VIHLNDHFILEEGFFYFVAHIKKSTRRTEREKGNNDIGDNIFFYEKKEIEKLMVIKRQFVIQ
jgi:hypothetical protein